MSRRGVYGRILPGIQGETAMRVTTRERPAKHSDAASQGPNWAADATLTEIIRRILATGEPQEIVLFGSRARGDARADSDYDLLLVELSDLPRHKRAARYRRALIGLAGAKDILVWTPEEVAQWHDVPNAFVTTAMQEGVVLCKRPPGEPGGFAPDTTPLIRSQRPPVG